MPRKIPPANRVVLQASDVSEIQSIRMLIEQHKAEARYLEEYLVLMLKERFHVDLKEENWELDMDRLEMVKANGPSTK